jgi:hypothetical protein
VGAELLGVADAPLCVPVAPGVPAGLDVCALAVDRGHSETKAAAPSAMAEVRRAPCIMATSLLMSGAARREKPPSPSINVENARASQTFL